ncbi:MAG: hypothetical protein Q9227_000935 [Pyrenula ochraceoflavens]
MSIRPPPRPSSSGSSESGSSNPTNIPVQKRSPFNAQLPTFSSTRPGSAQGSGNSSPLLRPSAQFMTQHDPPTRRGSPLAPPLELQKHRPRQHSQGFFEPSLPSASLSEMSGLTASQIAAQAAMQHLQSQPAGQQHMRKRSQTVPTPQDSQNQEVRRGSKGSPPPTQTSHNIQQQPEYHNGLLGNTAAATAANAAFPRGTAEGLEKEPRSKPSKMKLFSKPKHIGISRDREDKKSQPLPSPNKLGPAGASGLSRVTNASTTSLADSMSSSNSSSMYKLPNASGSVTTVINVERPQTSEKEKGHKHHFLSRQKLKLKDKDEYPSLTLSSASSNSRPSDPAAPQPLYSFAPSSPSTTSSFAKSMTGFDLRHGGRAMREKKKEEKEKEKAAATANALEPIHSREEPSEWPGTCSNSLGPTPLHSTVGTPFATDPALREALAGFGLNNMGPDDAWDFLKAKLLNIFEGEDVRIAVEDLNRLVIIWIQRCVQKHGPNVIIEDLNEFLHTGFLSLNHTLRSIPDDRLVPHLVSMWLDVFGNILPFMQAVFLPLDQEFKGHGSVLTTPAAASEFWGALPKHRQSSNPDLHGTTVTESTDISVGDALDVRRIVLVAFRDDVILPRFDTLKATFSRLSLDSINASVPTPPLPPAPLTATTPTAGQSQPTRRPAHSHSHSASYSRSSTPLDPRFSSFNSQGSTLLNDTSSSSGPIDGPNRSRATSNVSGISSTSSANEVTFQSFSSPPAAKASSVESRMVTETVGRMLQCISVLAGVDSPPPSSSSPSSTGNNNSIHAENDDHWAEGDEGEKARKKMEELGRELKLNWLGRGRTGRNRRGFVGTGRSRGGGVNINLNSSNAGNAGSSGLVGAEGRERERGRGEGSPTPTPTREGSKREAGTGAEVGLGLGMGVGIGMGGGMGRREVLA